MDCFVQALKVILNNLLPSQRQELASYLVPEVVTIFSLLSKVKTVLELSEYEVEENRNSQKKLETLEQYIDAFFHGKDWLRVVLDWITNTLLDFEQNMEFLEMLTRLHLAEFVTKLLKNLQDFMSEVEESIKTALETEQPFSKSKFCFKNIASKVSEVIKRLIKHKDVLEEFLIKFCKLVQSDCFLQNLVTLRLLDLSSTTAASTVNSSDEKETASSIQTPEHHPHSFNVKDSIFVSPPARRNNLSKAGSDLLKSGQESDMIFEVITSGEADGILDHTGGVSVESQTGKNPKPEIFNMAAHRVIVAARCDWFRKALLSGMQEDINRKIQVHNTTPYLFSLFLEYLYSGRLDSLSLTVDQLSELLLLSDRYELDSLKQICEYGLKSHLEKDSVLYFFIMANRLNAKILRSICRQFITKNPEAIKCALLEELPENLQYEEVPDDSRAASENRHEISPSQLICDLIDAIFAEDDDANRPFGLFLFS